MQNMIIWYFFVKYGQMSSLTAQVSVIDGA